MSTSSGCGQEMWRIDGSRLWVLRATLTKDLQLINKTQSCWFIVIFHPPQFALWRQHTMLIVWDQRIRVRWPLRRSWPISLVFWASCSLEAPSILRAASIRTLILFALRSVYLNIPLSESIFLHLFAERKPHWLCASASLELFSFKIEFRWLSSLIFVLFYFNHWRQWHFVFMSLDGRVTKTVESLLFIQLVLKVVVHMSG